MTPINSPHFVPQLLFATPQIKQIAIENGIHLSIAKAPLDQIAIKGKPMDSQSATNTVVAEDDGIF